MSSEYVIVCRECVQLLKELGRVEYIVLTTHAYEHKLFVAPFSRKFPDAQVCARHRGHEQHECMRRLQGPREVKFGLLSDILHTAA